jgi:hypothetical protein
MKNPGNLNGDKDERHRLYEALNLNQPLATAEVITGPVTRMLHSRLTQRHVICQYATVK